MHNALGPGVPRRIRDRQHGGPPNRVKRVGYGLRARSRDISDVTIGIPINGAKSANSDRPLADMLPRDSAVENFAERIVAYDAKVYRGRGRRERPARPFDERREFVEVRRLYGLFRWRRLGPGCVSAERQHHARKSKAQDGARPFQHWRQPPTPRISSAHLHRDFGAPPCGWRRCPPRDDACRTG